MDKLPEAQVAIKVPFFDVDPMRIVWHGHYVKYFEIARCELLNKIGYGYKEMEQSGFGWPVIDLNVRYLKSAVLGQDLLCSAKIVEYEHRLKIDYEIHCAKTGDRLTKGSSVQVAVSLGENVMQLMSPQIMLKKLGKL
ncbi:MAG: acyl-CoA thioesterase [Pseudomonadota bacterium]